MAIKIAKGAGNCVQIGNSDYPLDAFRALYGPTTLTLIAVKKNLIKAPKLVYAYEDLVDGDDTALGSDEATVRPKIQALIYSESAEAE